MENHPANMNVKTLKLYSFIIFGILLYSTSVFSNATNNSVKSKVDTNQIRIGEQFSLELNATANPNTELLFPILPDTFNHFEIVNRSKIDTIPNSNPLTLRQRFTITNFDSGFFVLPPFPFLSRDRISNRTDTLTTEAILIGVKTIAIDTTKEIKEIKPVMDVPYPWREYLPYIIGGLLLLGLLIYLAIRLAKKKSLPSIVPDPPKIPAHITAIENLKRIEEQKLWQNGQIKKYHSEVSDTIRTYIEHRFSIPAMEFTTYETLRGFGQTMINSEQKEKLRIILQTADLAKFAKSEPVSYENEQSMTLAIDFVMSTIPPTFENQKEEGKSV